MPPPVYPQNPANREVIPVGLEPARGLKQRPAERLGWRRRSSVLRRKARAAFLLVAGTWLGLGCSEPEQRAAEPAPAPAATPAPAPDAASARAEAEKIFNERCVTCHGPSGAGDGPASAGLVPKPRNFQDAAWQQSVTDAHIEQIIQYGGAAVARSPAMPANPDLMSKPAVVAALRAHVRALKK
jgi:mono/diheme cytochrome c family protein